MHHLPNAITLLRALLVLPIGYAFAQHRFDVVLGLFAFAALTDAVDGYLARRFGWESGFGTLADPIADKLLLLVSALALGLLGYLPEALLMLMLAKEAAVLGGIASYCGFAGFPRIRPLLVGKITTFLQMILVLGIIAGVLTGVRVPDWAWWLVAAATLVDGCSYLWIWTVRLTEDPRWWRVPDLPREGSGTA